MITMLIQVVAITSVLANAVVSNSDQMSWTCPCTSPSRPVTVHEEQAAEKT